MNLAEPGSTQHALQVIYVLVQAGSNVHAPLLAIKNNLELQCEKLHLFRDFLHQMAGLDPRDGHLTRPPRRLRRVFKEASACLPSSPLDSRAASKNLSCISKTISFIYELQQLRQRSLQLLQKLAGGTTTYHLRRFLGQLSQRSETFVRELVSLLNEFWSEHLIDALQATVEEILVFEEAVERESSLTSVLEKVEIPWTSEYQLFFARLQRNFIPQIPIPLGDQEKRARSGDFFQLPSPISLSPDSDSSGPLSQSPSERSLRKRSPSKRPKSSGQVLPSPRKGTPSPRKTDATLLTKLHKQITMQGEQLTQLKQFVDRISTPGESGAMHSPTVQPYSQLLGSSPDDTIVRNHTSPVTECPPIEEDSEVIHTQAPPSPVPEPLRSPTIEHGTNNSSPVMNLNLTPLRNRKRPSGKKRSRSTRLSLGLSKGFNFPPIHGSGKLHASTDVSLRDVPQNKRVRTRSSLHSPAERFTDKSFSGPYPADDRPLTAREGCTPVPSPRLLRQKSMPRKRLAHRCNGYWMEEGLPRDAPIQFTPPDENHLELPDGTLPTSEWFHKYFEEDSYVVFISPVTPEGNVVLLSKRETGDKPNLYRLLYRSSTRTVGALVTITKNKLLGKPNYLKQMVQAIDPLLSFKSFQRCDQVDRESLKELDQLELNQVFRKTTYKFGVLNWQEGNTNEEDMFSNCTISPDFESFLSILGDQVDLEGWEGYNGGLDTTTPGRQSLFTSYQGISIMFHVAPYLPYSAKNRQQLDRKRHIGNDVAIIIFNEASQPYLTSLIASRFNHIIFVVSSERQEDGTVHYSVTITAKEVIPTFGPPLPPRGLFTSKMELRQFLLRKLINGEKASSHAPVFENRLTRSREMLLQNLVEANYQREE